MRTVVDKRAQNANTKKIATPLPDIDTILRNVVRHRWRSLIDGKDAYEQIRVIPEHVPRTLFNTPDGTMESLVMQIGDCNGSATYQSLMNHIFSEHLGVWMDVYLDDIIVYSDSLEDHVRHIQTVFQILRNNNFYLSVDKMQLFAQELKILGHIIDGDGIRMDPHKVDSIANWKVPTSRALLQSFLGAVGFLAPDCYGIRIPMGVLTPLTGKNRPWRWGATEQRAFEEIKTLVVAWRDQHRVALDYSADAPKINLVTDASLTGGSGFISQGDELATSKVVAFWSGKFNSAQQNYPVHELELLAIVESLKRFRGMLHGTKFRICTDHKALQHFMSQKNLSARQSRWLDVLNEFEFEIFYIPGKTNTLADSLSRLYSEDAPGTVRAHSEYVVEDHSDDESPLQMASLDMGVPNACQFSAPLLTGAEGLWAAASVPQPEANDRIGTAAGTPAGRPKRKAAEEAQRGWAWLAPRKRSHPVPNRPDPEDQSGDAATAGDVDPGKSRPKPAIEDTEPPAMEGAIEEPGNGPQQVLHAPAADGEGELLDYGDADLGAVIQSTEQALDIPASFALHYANDKFFKTVVERPNDYSNFREEGGIIYLNTGDENLICVPEFLHQGRSIREIIIEHAHRILAHLGASKTAQYVRARFWWKDIISDVQHYCQTCSLCALNRTNTQAPFGRLQPLPVPSRPWESIGIDFVGPLPGSFNRLGRFDMLCVIIDHLTSMVHLLPTKITDKASDIAEVVFDHVYKLHGLPERIVSDRDSLFTSVFWKRLHELIGVELRMSSAYHPETDGATERANRTITQMVRICALADQHDWVRRLPAIEFALNSAVSDTTGFSPFYLNYGQVPRALKWDARTSRYPGVRAFAQRMKDAILQAHDSIIHARVKQTRQANRHRRAAPFAAGDFVYLSTKNLSLPAGVSRKLSPRYIGPFQIEKVVVDGSSYKLGLPRDLMARGINPVFHASLLRVFRENEDKRFPGRQLHELTGFRTSAKSWTVIEITDHYGRGKELLFEVKWNTGHVTWERLREVKKLTALENYLQAMGVVRVADLPVGKGKPGERSD